MNALGNLANLLWEKGIRDQAANLYRRALEVDPGNERVTWNYARFLLRDSEDPELTCRTLDQGINPHPESGRLLQLRGELSLRNRKASEAVEDFRQAREKGAEQATIEADYAVALQLSGASTAECIAAYRVAIALNPADGALKLNLAQLLFIKGDDMDGNKQLRMAMRLQLDTPAQLEANFYLLCHTSSDPAVIFQTTKSLLTQGARLSWDVRPNIETVRQRDLLKATLLDLVFKVMQGNRDQEILDQVLARWPQRQRFRE